MSVEMTRFGDAIDKDEGGERTATDRCVTSAHGSGTRCFQGGGRPSKWKRNLCQILRHNLSRYGWAGERKLGSNEEAAWKS